MGGSPCRPRGPPGDHGWRRASAGTGVREVKKKKPKNLSQRTGASPGLRLCRRGDRFTRHHGCQGARRAGLSGARRRRPRPRAASGRPSPRLSPRAAPPAAPGSASPATTAGPGGDGGAPGGGRPGMGWRAPRPPHARDGRVAPILLSRLPVGPPSPSLPPGLLAVSSDVSRPPPRCRLGDVVPGCEALGSSRATQLCGLRPCLLEGTNAPHRPCRSQARAEVDGD